MGLKLFFFSEMERHIAYLQSICRVCSGNCEKKYSLAVVSEILKEAYKDKDECDINNDSEFTESKVICSVCYNKLKRWHKDWLAFKKYRQKNPQSSKEFSTGVKLPDSIENPIIHLEDNCPCLIIADIDAQEDEAVDVELEASMMDVDEAQQEESDTSVVVPDPERDDDGKTPSKLQR